MQNRHRRQPQTHHNQAALRLFLRVIFGVIILDQQRFYRSTFQGVLHHRHKFAVNNDNFRLGMIKLKSNARRLGGY